MKVAFMKCDGCKEKCMEEYFEVTTEWFDCVYAKGTTAQEKAVTTELDLCGIPCILNYTEAISQEVNGKSVKLTICKLKGTKGETKHVEFSESV